MDDIFVIDGTRKQITITLFYHVFANDESRYFCLRPFVFRVRDIDAINANFFVLTVYVIDVDVLTAIITVDFDLLDVVIDATDTGAGTTDISAEFVSLTFVINVIIFDVVKVFFIEVIADIIFDIDVIGIITFIAVHFTANTIDIHLLAFVDVVNVIVVVIINVTVVVITIFFADDMIVDTDIAIVSIIQHSFSFVFAKGF